MEPYWKNDLVTVYNSDGRRTQFLPPGSVDLVVTSPPYYKCEHIWGDIWRDCGIKNFQDYNEWLKEFFVEWYRLLPEGHYVIVNTSNITEEEEAYNNKGWTSIGLEAAGFNFVDEIIWAKHKTTSMRYGVLVQNPYPRMYYPNQIHEVWFVYRKGRRVHDHSKWKDQDKLPAKSDSFLNQFRNDIWAFSTVSAKAIGHVTPFPEDMVSAFISLYSFTGETVLDPFGGSGTTALAAMKLGRKSIMFEIDGDYCDDMIGRINCEGLINV